MNERYPVPRVKSDLDMVSQKVWGGRALSSSLSAMERMLMTDADAPVMFDALPLRDSETRSKLLVASFRSMVVSNPIIIPLFRSVADVLKNDRREREVAVDDYDSALDFEEDVSTITRQVEVRAAYRPRA